MVYLVLGGARSGKSSYAQRLAEELGSRRLFLATAEALDEEMTRRIARHKADRGTGWETVEVPLDLARTIELHSKTQTVYLVDCLTLWLSNLMHAGRDVDAETETLCEALKAATGNVILVSNEVGLGLVPETPLGREFRDAQGRLNQKVAAVCDQVDFIAAGLPIKLKG